MDDQDCILKSFQLRAARVTTGVELSTIGNLIGFTKACISRWEQKASFTKLKTTQENILTIKEFFIQHNILFPDEHSIALTTTLKGNKMEGLTRFQLRAARAILNISQEELASFVRIPKYVIGRAELLGNNMYIRPSSDKMIPIKLKHFFQIKNFVFDDGLNISFFESEKSH